MIIVFDCKGMAILRSPQGIWVENVFRTPLSDIQLIRFCFSTLFPSCKVEKHNNQLFKNIIVKTNGSRDLLTQILIPIVIESIQRSHRH